MWIESVTAHMFGPLAGGTLSFAPGMTVVVGENESGKSSWHAAAYVALCGRRRRKGAPSRDEQRFTALHRPWDGDEWRVSCVIELAHGRRIELRHDLDGKVNCSALDLALGRDVSNEIMFEGAPDGARWLELDRRTFGVTACVKQADVRRVLAAADGLQTALQRAANAGTDATAAAALDLLDAFARERVGKELAHSVKPLPAAIRELARARAAFDGAVAAHAEYLRLGEAADALRADAVRLAAFVANEEQRLAALEHLAQLAAVAARAEAERVRAEERAADRSAELAREQRRLERIVELNGRFGGRPPATKSDAEEVSQAVAAALAAWASAPACLVLTGPSAGELRHELDTLPDAPAGETVVHPDVRGAMAELSEARAVASAHDARQPGPLQDDSLLVAGLAAGPPLLREFAHALDQPVAALDPAKIAVLDAARIARATAEQRWRTAQAAEANARDVHRAAVAARDEVVREFTARSARDEVARSAAAERLRQRAVAHRRRLGFVAGACGAGVLGVVLLALGMTVAGEFAAIAAVALAATAGIVRAPREATVAVSDARGMSAEDVEAAEEETREAATAVEAASEETATAADELSEAERQFAAAEAAVEVESHAVAEVSAARDEVLARCVALTVPVDPIELRSLAARTERALAAQEAVAQWRSEARRLAALVAAAEEGVRAALASRLACDGAATADDLFARYETACANRAVQAAAAARRAGLAGQLEDRQRAESAAAAAAVARTEAERRLRAAAAAIAADPEAGAEVLLAALKQWQVRHAKAMPQADAARAEWQELQTLLGGATVTETAAGVEQLRSDQTELVAAAERAEQAATEAIKRRDDFAEESGFKFASAEAVEAAASDQRSRLGVARREVAGALAAAENADGARRQLAASVPSVPEAEEAVAAAEAELDRIRELERTLDLTRGFLRAAQDKVHRDIAPVLAGTLREWLPSVTVGRYVDPVVDPATLGVKVCGATRAWRSADALSHGTAEQVYLLLRMALAQHLTKPEEVCPLLLDDVTVQADARRTLEILDLLHQISGTRQVVLFSQEQQVAEWGSNALTGANDTIVTLAPMPST